MGGDVLGDVLEDGDLLLMMGAGDIGHAAQQLVVTGFKAPAADAEDDA